MTFYRISLITVKLAVGSHRTRMIKNRCLILNKTTSKHKMILKLKRGVTYFGNVPTELIIAGNFFEKSKKENLKKN